MKRLHIPNELVEWVFIIVGVTIAALVGAGLKSWLDNALADTGVVGWVPGVAALVAFFVLAAPFYYWASRSAKARGEEGADTEPDVELDDAA